MLAKIVSGARVYKVRHTSTGMYFTCYFVADNTGRKVDLVTVCPFHTWEKPFAYYYQLPVQELIDQDEFDRLTKSEKLHPAMTL